jgi:hypothetical protein
MKLIIFRPRDNSTLDHWVVQIKDLKAYTTNEEFKVVDLKTSRKINKNRNEIYIFKEFNFSISAGMVPTDQSDTVYVLKNLPVKIHVSVSVM